MSKEKTYLKWYNKVGYGSGDVAGNVVYALLTSFVMIYLTDTIGLNAGVIGVLIAVSKIFDGITDIIFGALIDKTHTKMGKAKPWMLYGFIGCAITLIGVFAIPMNMDNFEAATCPPITTPCAACPASGITPPGPLPALPLASRRPLWTATCCGCLPGCTTMTPT